MNIKIIGFLFLNHTIKNKITLHKLIHHECGEVSLSKKVAPFALKFGNLHHGPCKLQGYDVYTRKERVSMGPFGHVLVDIFSRR